MTTDPAAAPPPAVADYAARTVDYVDRALSKKLAYDSETLPLLDYYLTTVPGDQPDMVALVTATAAAYFGEVIRRRLGGRWEGVTAEEPDPGVWRLVLPTGISFSPARIVGDAVTYATGGEVKDVGADSDLDAPPRIRPHLQEVLERMGALTEDEYYSLCGRLDSIEHVHESLVGVAASLLGDEQGETDEEPDEQN